jgi:hypothetical protein
MVLFLPGVQHGAALFLLCPRSEYENISNDKTIPDAVLTHGHILFPGMKKITVPGNNLVI